MQTKAELMALLRDFADFCQMKGVTYPPIYLLGGSGAILSGYLTRATIDFDLLDVTYDAVIGKYLRVLGTYDLLDIELTSIPLDFRDRALSLEGFQNIFVLSAEDILLSKLGRYSEKDERDIELILEYANLELVYLLADSVINRECLSHKVKTAFKENLIRFKRAYHA